MTTPLLSREEWEPSKIDQTVTGNKGNCQSACLAMILGIPISSVPNFFDGLELDDPDLTDKWNQAERVWLESLGWASITLNVEGGYFEKHFSKGFLIVSGQSVRGLSHAVVYKDGELWHDPFPGGQGVNVVREVEVVYPLRPFVLLDSQSQLTAAREEVERLRREKELKHPYTFDIIRDLCSELAKYVPRKDGWNIEQQTEKHAYENGREWLSMNPIEKARQPK